MIYRIGKECDSKYYVAKRVKLLDRPCLYLNFSNSKFESRVFDNHYAKSLREAIAKLKLVAPNLLKISFEKVEIYEWHVAVFQGPDVKGSDE